MLPIAEGQLVLDWVGPERRERQRASSRRSAARRRGESVATLPSLLDAPWLGGPLPVRFWASVWVPFAPDACWTWLGALSNGYGRATVDGRQRPAHRVAYERLVGPVPEGRELDHRCRQRSCVNPLHLRPVTSRTNTLLGVGPSAVNHRKTECQFGHPFDRRDTRGGRICSTCARSTKRLIAARRRAGPAPFVPIGGGTP